MEVSDDALTKELRDYIARKSCDCEGNGHYYPYYRGACTSRFWVLYGLSKILDKYDGKGIYKR